MPSFLRFFHWKARRPTSRIAELKKIKEDLRLRQADRGELARIIREDALKVQTLELKVKIHCHGCLKSVKKALRNIDGVYQSTVDAATGKVTVCGLMDPDTVMMKLRKAGKPAQLWGAENNPGVVEVPLHPQPTVKQMEEAKFPLMLKTNDEDLKDDGLDDDGLDEDDIHKMLMKRLGMPPTTVGGKKESGGIGTSNGGGNTNTNNGSGKEEDQANKNGGTSQQKPQNGNGASGTLALGSGNRPVPGKIKKKKSRSPMIGGMPPQQHMAAVMQQQQQMMMMNGAQGGHGYPPQPPASGYGYDGSGLPVMPQYPPAYYYPMPQRHPHDNMFSDENPNGACSVM